jgi:hypothetical protein
MSIDGYCICDVMVQNEQVFKQGDAISQELLLNTLSIGAFEPSMFGSSYLSSQESDVIVHKKSGLMDTETIFEFIDSNGIRQLRKNLHSPVYIVGSNLSF